MNKTDKVFGALGVYILVEEADNIQINKYMSGSDKCQKKIKGTKATENDGRCYLRQDGQGKPLLIRRHLSRDPQEVREWVMWVSGGIAFQAAGASAKVQRWEYVWCIQRTAAGADVTGLVSDEKSCRRGAPSNKQLVLRNLELLGQSRSFSFYSK